MTARSFISSHRNCRRFLTATHHAKILNNSFHDLQVLHFTMERGVMTPQRIEPVFTERYESGESVLSAQVNSVKGVYITESDQIVPIRRRFIRRATLRKSEGGTWFTASRF